MTELQFWADLKKNSIRFFGSALVVQMILGIAWIIWTGSDVRSTGIKNTEDIRCIRQEVSQKATIQMVLQIKADQAEQIKMITRQYEDLKAGQASMINLLLNHIATKK